MRLQGGRFPAIESIRQGTSLNDGKSASPFAVRVVAQYPKRGVYHDF